MRATPSIPNLRHSHVISSPLDPPSTENIIRRPLPKPVKTRSSTLTSIPKPPDRQAVALISSTSSSHVPESAPVLQADCDSSWTDSTPSDHHTAPRAMDRSDTLASVKSLDRWDLSQTTKQKPTISGRERPLPSAPLLHQARGLATSRSLDRGNLRNGTHPPRILSLTPASNTKMHGCSDASVESGRSSVAAQTSAAPVLSREDTYPRSVSPKQLADSASNALEALQKQINSAMADFRIGDRPVDRNTESADAATSKATNADHSQTKRLTKQSVGNDCPQVAPISLNGIPTIVFLDSEEESPTIVPPAARATSPGPSAGYASAPPAITIKITTEDAEKIPTPAMNVSEQGRELENSAVQSLPVMGTSISNPRAPSQPRAGATSDEALPSSVTCGIFCHACDLVILGNIVNAMEKGWHPACFKCTTCRMPLEHVSSFEHEGKPYCHMDYHEQFAPKCHHCSTPIIDQRFITIDDLNFGKRFYHELHFFCGECGIPFLDPSQSSSAGTELKGRGNQGDPAQNHEEEQTAAFVIHGKHAFCPECDIKLHRPKCKGCRKPIRSEDEALEALKAKWHRACFKCTVSCDPACAEKEHINEPVPLRL
ncbi:hypothetical protein QFC22_004947 [Naganishia vaughanmartiniae]|uniref:Uncharacterized protein n=1 Tax=Naganishia vaughanmartiniae TaxID=1424756 RepID=A0ACC2WWL7_9TREE|nr:hypothetical protein QFC22_004947 [Naganishia vaughanmartiniae]